MSAAADDDDDDAPPRSLQILISGGPFLKLHFKYHSPKINLLLLLMVVGGFE